MSFFNDFKALPNKLIQIFVSNTLYDTLIIIIADLSPPQVSKMIMNAP